MVSFFWNLALPTAGSLPFVLCLLYLVSNIFCLILACLPKDIVFSLYLFKAKSIRFIGISLGVLARIFGDLIGKIDGLVGLQ